VGEDGFIERVLLGIIVGALLGVVVREVVGGIVIINVGERVVGAIVMGNIEGKYVGNSGGLEGMLVEGCSEDGMIDDGGLVRGVPVGSFVGSDVLAGVVGIKVDTWDGERDVGDTDESLVGDFEGIFEVVQKVVG